jgi:PAS domain S-box-containing protein
MTSEASKHANSHNEAEERIHQLENRIAELEEQNQALKLSVENDFSTCFNSSFRKIKERYDSHFRKLLSSIPVAYQSLDEEGRIIDVNPFWLKLLGYKKEEVTGLSFGSLWEMDRRELFPTIFKSFKDNCFIENADLKLICKNGDLIDVVLTGSIETDDKGNFGKTHCILHNITRLKHLQKNLEENEAFLLQSQEVAKVGSYNLDISSGVWTSTKTLDEIFGIDTKFTRSPENWLSIVHEKDREIMANYFFEEVITNRNNFDKIYRITNQRDHETRWVHGKGKLFYNWKGEPVRMIGTIQDITQMREIEQKLRESNAAKDRFFSIMAHDLRSPIQSILGLSEFLSTSDSILADEENADLTHLIFDSANKTYNLLESLLDWGKVQSSTMEINCQQLPLRETIQESCELTEQLAHNKDITVELSCPDNIKVYADKNLLNTVLRNLLSNAIKYSHRKGLIQLTVHSSDEDISIKISDQGIGMKPENMKKLFRIDEVYTSYGTEKEKGSGLGLILCKEFVEMMNGNIYVESKYGEGSAFTIGLPIAKK